MSLHFAKLVFFIPYRHGTPSSFCGNGRQSVGRDAEAHIGQAVAIQKMPLNTKPVKPQKIPFRIIFATT